MAAEIVPNPNAPKLPKDTVLRPIELDDEGNEEVTPVTPAPKRPRNNKRVGSDSDDNDELTTTTTKRPRHIGSSPPSSAVDPQERRALSQADEDLAMLQRQMDEYNLQNSRSDEEGVSPGGDENDVEKAMTINDEESQDL
ncbi:hypothetical protein FRC07_008552 [Ceratobasidium sp. 392]|nr:hypothetical protein FRC07_008552 [Ceratobasidium sp. 392]